MRRRHIGIVFQFFNLLEGMSVLENVTLPAVIAGAPRKRAETRARDLLDLLGLADKAKDAPGVLSGGQRQRLAIARALANEPTLLLADEPTGALDSEGGHEVLELFRRLHAGGQTILLVTHDDDVAAAADRIVRDARRSHRDRSRGGSRRRRRPPRSSATSSLMGALRRCSRGSELRRRWRSVMVLTLLVGFVGAGGARRWSPARAAPRRSLARFEQDASRAPSSRSTWATAAGAIDRFRRSRGVEAVGQLHQLTLFVAGGEFLPTAAQVDDRFGRVVDRRRVVEGRLADLDAVDELNIGESLAAQRT